MATQGVEYRPEIRAKQISLLLEQIESVRSKNLKPINNTTSYYIFALCKNNKAIASTNETIPEFVCKVSPSITKAVDNTLEGFGPLLVIQHNKIQLDLQLNYKQESLEHYYVLKELGAFDIRKQKKKKQQETKAEERLKKEVEEKAKAEQPTQLANTKQETQPIKAEEERLKKEAEEKANTKQETQPIKAEEETRLTKAEETQPIKAEEERLKKEVEEKANTEQLIQPTNTEQLIQPTNTEQLIQPANTEQPTNVEQPTKNIVELSIVWNNDKPYIQTPINAFSNTNASSETLLYNITRELNTNDTAFLDYTANAPSGFTLQPLNHVFCDNIVLYYYIRENLIQEGSTLQQYITKQQEKGKEQFELRDSNVLSELGDILSEHTSKIVRVFRKLGIPLNKPQLKPTKAIWDNGSLQQFVKISLADAPLNVVLSLVCDKSTIYTLQEEGLYINDIDITQDFAGTFNKAQLIQHLIQDGRFCIEGCSKHREYTIMDNDSSVGASCLTFLYNDPLTEQTIRYKYYNKFVQSMESAGVRETVGNHLLDWISNPEEVLKESIRKCLDTGLLRLEITFYMEGTQYMEEAYIEQHMDWLQKLIPTSLIYHQPITKQWELYASAITSNLMLVDTDNNKALFSYTTNSLTGKVNGFYLSNTNTNKLSNLLKQYSYNVPIYVVCFRRSGDELWFQYDTYYKVLLPNKKLNRLPTYLANSKKGFSRARPKDDITPQQMGLIDLANVSLSYSPKQDVSRNTSTIPIVFDTIEWKPLVFPKESRRSRLNRNAEEEAQQDLIKLNKQQLQALREENDTKKQEITKEFRELLDRQLQQREDCLNKLTSINEITNNKTRLLKLLNRPAGNVQALTSLDLYTKLYIYGVRYTNGRYGETVVLAANTEPKNKDLKLYWSNTTAKAVIDANKDVWGFVEPNIILSSTNKPLAILEIRSFYYNKSHHKCASIICLPVIKTATNKIDEETISTKTQEIEQQIAALEEEHEQTLQESPLLIRDRRLVATGGLDDVVKEGDVVSIQACYPYRKSYIIQCCIDNGNLLFLKSNRFLDDLLDNATRKFSVMVGVKKLHPTARRTMFSFISEA